MEMAVEPETGSHHFNLQAALNFVRYGYSHRQRASLALGSQKDHFRSVTNGSHAPVWYGVLPKSRIVYSILTDSW